MKPIDIKRYLDFWEDEMGTAYLYRNIAQIEPNERLADVYIRLADVERHHAKKWESKLAEAGQSVPAFKPDMRIRILLWVARKFGPSTIIQTLRTREQDGAKAYSQNQEMQSAADEKSHAFVLNQMRDVFRGGMEGSALAQLEGRHKASGGNALRAAVLGANDGLVSNMSLVMGVAGASDAGSAVLVAGIAGLLAGAFSMALGEWLSVQSSRELYQNQLEIEKLEIEESPEEEIEELALIYEARGMSRAQAVTMAENVSKNSSDLLDVMAREELGINPEELGGSAWEAAITSFLLFSIGAIIPVIPFFFAHGYQAVILSLGFSVIGLFALGAGITLFTGRKVLFSGMRMVLFGLGAALLTFAIGKLIGVSLS